jgi:hypothetical protein
MGCADAPGCVFSGTPPSPHARREPCAPCQGVPCPDARDELLGSEDVAVVPLLEPSPEEEDLLVPQFLVVAVIEQASGAGLDVRSPCEIDPEDARWAVRLRTAADAVGVPFTVAGVQNCALEKREVFLDLSPRSRPPLAASRGRRQARRESGAASRRCRASCSTSPWGNASGSWSRTFCLRAECSRSSSSTPSDRSGRGTGGRRLGLGVVDVLVAQRPSDGGPTPDAGDASQQLGGFHHRQS